MSTQTMRIFILQSRQPEKRKLLFIWLIFQAITPQNILPSQCILLSWNTDLFISPINYLRKQKGTWASPGGKRNVNKISKLRINSRFLVGQSGHNSHDGTEHSLPLGFPTSTSGSYSWPYVFLEFQLFVHLKLHCIHIKPYQHGSASERRSLNICKLH